MDAKEAIVDDAATRTQEASASAEPPEADPAESVVPAQQKEQCVVFISHATENRDLAVQLSRELASYGVESILAHKDIAISADWGLELERMLTCCDALVYLATDASNRSPWCQQEVGWSLGRGIPVVPIIVDKVPAAFMGRRQAFSLDGVSMAQAAQRVVGCLLHEEGLTNTLIDSLLELLGKSRSYDQSNTIGQCLAEAPGITQRQAQVIERIIADNNQVRDAGWGRLPDALRGLKVVG